jgi:hemoglobin
MTEVTLYERVGGQPFFAALVERFYDGVSGDLVLRSMYPDDLTESKRHLALFLAQYWGGSTEYEQLRGHPRLRRRHARFVITREAREAWLTHMWAALATANALDPEDRLALEEYFTMAARQLQNQ